MIKIGIIGSCVSKDTFRSVFNPNYKNEFEEVFNHARTSIVSLMQTPLFLDDELIKSYDPNKTDAQNSWNTQVIKNDMEKNVFQDLKNIDYLILDFYFEALFGVLSYKNTLITNNFWDLPSTQFYKNLESKETLDMFNSPDKYFNLWKKCCNDFFNYMNQNYPSVKIILNKVKMVDHVLKEDGSKYIDNNFTDRAERINPILNKFEDYIEENFNVDVIDVFDDSVYADESHIWGVAPVHYNKNYYNKVYQRIKEIVNENKYISLNYNSEFAQLSKDEFFIIDSDNLSEVNSYLYGFMVSEDGIFLNEDLSEDTEISSLGSYVYIKKSDDDINIYQDFNGSYGIYIYQNEESFVVSNSFLKLVEYVKHKHVITLDQDYSNMFISTEFCSTILENTLIKEIKLIPRYSHVKINIKSKSINVEKINYNENSIPIDSKEGIVLLDKWFNKWIKIIRFIKSHTNNISIDLSGGFDSRVILALMLSSGINLNDIYVNNYAANKIEFIEDHEIAKEIGEKFNFTLNNPNNRIKKRQFKQISTPINISNYVKLGFHKEFFWQSYYSEQPSFSFAGFAGESIKYYGSLIPKEYLNNVLIKTSSSSPSFVPSVKLLYESSFNFLRDFYSIDDENSRMISKYLYNDGRCRNHYGKATVESYLANSIILTPLLDSDLRKIKINSEHCNDFNLLIAVIYSRYCPELLNFKFQGNRFIEDETIEYAKQINKLYPFEKKVPFSVESNLNNFSIFKRKIIDDKEDVETNNLVINNNTIEKIYKNVFSSNLFKSQFVNQFSSRLYYKILSEMDTLTYGPFQNIIAAISIIHIINQCEFSVNNKIDTFVDWFNNILTDNSVNIMEEDNGDIDPVLLNKLEKFYTLRADIKSSGNNNDIVIIKNSDKNCRVSYPNWFSDDKGRGMILESTSCSMDLELKCVNEGKLLLYFKGINFSDKFRNNFPIYIDIVKLTINNEIIINSNKTVSLNKPFVHAKMVDDSEIVKIHVEWEPISQKSELN